MARFKGVMGKVLKGLLVLLLLVAALPALTGNLYFYRALRATYFLGHTTANIDDAAVFDQRAVKAGAPQPWPVSPACCRLRWWWPCCWPWPLVACRMRPGHRVHCEAWARFPPA